MDNKRPNQTFNHIKLYKENEKDSLWQTVGR